MHKTVSSCAIVASYTTRSRTVPSFAADMATKMRFLREDRPFHEENFTGTVGSIPNLCYNAARTTLNITNQLLNAKMHGQRPLLVSMGTNALSSNWGRFAAWIIRYHDQYGVLDILVRITSDELETPGRKEDLISLCPDRVDDQYFVFHNSNDFVCHEQGDLNNAFVVWHTIMDGHKDKSGCMSNLSTKFGGSRIGR